jgi:hypothetical protein
MAQKTASSDQIRRRRDRRSRDEYLVLRTVYMPTRLDNALRMKAEKMHKSKNAVIREILSAAVAY